MTGLTKVVPIDFTKIFNTDAATKRTPRRATVTRRDAGSHRATVTKVPPAATSQPQTKAKTLPILRTHEGPAPDLEMGVMALAVKKMYDEFHKPLSESLQNIHTPFALCYEILSKLEIEPSKTFLVVSAVEFVAVLIDVFNVPIRNIFFLDEGVKSAKMPTSVKGALMEHVFHMPKQNILHEETVIMKKFDFVVGNPPYVGAAALHQQFFVKGFELINESGCIAFIQPATPYFNKKNVRKKAADLKMVEIIK